MPVPLGMIVHVTAVLLVLLTKAVRGCACVGYRVAFVGLTVMLTGAETETTPPVAEIGNELPSAATASTFAGWMSTAPDAAVDNVTFRTAIMPFGTLLLFIPETMHLLPLHVMDLPAEVPDAPIVDMIPTIPGEATKSHWRATG